MRHVNNNTRMLLYHIISHSLWRVKKNKLARWLMAFSRVWPMKCYKEERKKHSRFNDDDSSRIINIKNRFLHTHSRHHNIFDSISKSLEKAEEEEDMRVSRVPL